MNLPHNVGRLDAYLRITLGLAALVWGAAGRLGRWGPLLTLAGAMKVAEGVTGYCPMLHALSTRTTDRPEVEHAQGTAESDAQRGSERWPTPGVTGRNPRHLRTGRVGHLPED